MTHFCESTDVLVVGGGIIGAAAAWRCAQRGMSVTVVDSAQRRGAWWTAAGMLAPMSELYYGETALMRLGAESLDGYRSFVTELTEQTGLSTGFEQCGTITVAWDGADLAALADLRTFAEQQGMTTDLVTGRQVRDLEPGLAAGLPGGVLSPDDHQVDPRRLHRALKAAGEQCGVRVIDAEANLDVVAGRCVGARLSDGRCITAGAVVLATGAWAGLDGAAGRWPVRPVKGHTLRLKLGDQPALNHVVRGTVRGSAIYLVPRADGRLVVGASSEEAGFDDAARAGAVYETLRDAQTLFPELAEAVLEEVAVGFRPGTPDNLPMIGRSGVKGLTIATGHYRNGILLAPLTAHVIASVLAGADWPDHFSSCDPRRFDKAAQR